MTFERFDDLFLRVSYFFKVPFEIRQVQRISGSGYRLLICTEYHESRTGLPPVRSSSNFGAGIFAKLRHSIGLHYVTVKIREFSVQIVLVSIIAFRRV